jgi:hypothetical protein
MWASKYLKEIPDLSKATNIEKLDFGHCWSLVELPSSIRNLNKLLELNMEYCGELETLPTGFNLKSLDYLNFNECWKLRTFPEFATNISNLILAETSIEEYPSNLYFKNVRELSMGKADSDENKCQGVKVYVVLSNIMRIHYMFFFSKCKGKSCIEYYQVNQQTKNAK